jgi:hypothetical protein
MQKIISHITHDDDDDDVDDDKQAHSSLIILWLVHVKLTKNFISSFIKMWPILFNEMFAYYKM